MRGRENHRLTAIIVVVLATLGATAGVLSCSAMEGIHTVNPPTTFAPGQVIVGFTDLDSLEEIRDELLVAAASLSVEAGSSPQALHDAMMAAFEDAATTHERAERLSEELGIRLIEFDPFLLAALYEVPSGQENEWVRRLTELDGVASADLNYTLTTQALDPYEPEQWGLFCTEAIPAWDACGLPEVDLKVAVIDTGVDYTHPDLEAVYLPEGWDLVDDDADPMDENIVSHGTHVAGIVAAEINGYGIMGVAPGAGIVPFRVLNAAGYGYVWDVAKAIVLATFKCKVSVINMSLGGPFPAQCVEEAVNEAFWAGCVIVAAAGNDADCPPCALTGPDLDYPAAYNVVHSVGALDRDCENAACFSCCGADVMAPGVHVVSDVAGGGFAWLSGTSMAAPHVAGIAALILWNHGGPFSLSPQEVYDILIETAIDLGPAGWDLETGYGKVNAQAACSY